MVSIKERLNAGLDKLAAWRWSIVATHVTFSLAMAIMAAVATTNFAYAIFVFGCGFHAGCALKASENVRRRDRLTGLTEFEKLEMENTFRAHMMSIVLKMQKEGHLITMVDMEEAPPTASKH